MKHSAKFGVSVKLHSCGLAAVFAALTCIAVFPTGSKAQVTSPQTEKLVEVEITGPASVMAGEPIVLKYRITNRLKHPVELHEFGGPTRTWVRLELLDSEDQVIYKEPERKRPSVGMVIDAVSPGAAAEGTIIASSRVLPKSPGRYTLRANVVFTCTQSEGDKFIGVTRTVRNVIDVPIEASAADEERLTKVAYRLRNQFLSAKGLEKDSILAALLSMKESAALPAWRSLVDDPKMEHDGYGSGILSRELGVLATPNAVDLLIRMWGGDAEALRPGAKGTLQDLYRETTDATLKAHIRQGFEAIGGSPDDLYDGPIKIIKGS